MRKVQEAPTHCGELTFLLRQLMLVRLDDIQAPYFTASLIDQNVRNFRRDFEEYIPSEERHFEVDYVQDSAL